MTRQLRIGTRGSALALVQARWVAARLADEGTATELVIIRTEGDDRPVDTAWGEGAFVARIVSALLDGTIDVAVHSAKDVPTDEHPDLVIAAYPGREDPRDALVCRERGATLATLPYGSRVGTDSPRRTAFLRAVRPDLVMHPLHGNVDTRLAKLDRGDSDALVLAVAGLTRLGRADRIDEILPAVVVPSAPGQGSLAVQVRASDAEAVEAVGRLDDPATRAAVVAERALLNATGGGCRSPIGAIGQVEGGVLELLAGAERTWTPVGAPPIAVSPVVLVRGRAPVDAGRDLAARLAARIVALRERPRALIARPAGQADLLATALEAIGVDAVHVPAIEIVPVVDGDLDAAVAGAGLDDWFVVTSANAARASVAAFGRAGVRADLALWAAVGPATAAILAEAGVPVSFVPTVATGDALARELPVLAGERVILPRADIAAPALVTMLARRGAEVAEVVAYRTLEAPEASRPLLAAALDAGPVDVLVLTSGSTARGLAALAGPGDGSLARLLGTPAVAMGEPTAKVARAIGFERVLVAPSPGVASLAGFVAASLGVGAPDGHDPRVDVRHEPHPEPAADPVPSGGSR